jgi:hypothetical protein
MRFQFVFGTIKLCGCFPQNDPIALLRLRLSRQWREFVFVPKLKESVYDWMPRHRKFFSLVRRILRGRGRARAT